MAEVSVAEAPPSIQQHLENSPFLSARLDESIRVYIKRAFIKQTDGFCYAWSAGGRADEMNPSMAWILSEIERLAEKQDGLLMAFNLMIYLSENICATVENRGAQYGFWSSDTPADNLLLSLATRLKEEKAEFNPAQQASSLAWQIKRLRSFGIQTFFPRSHDLMQSWAEGPEAAPRLHDTLKDEITAAHANIKDRIENHGERLTSDDYSAKMLEFIPHVRRLSTLSPVGLRLAFDLTIYLGQQSYGSLENGGRGAPNRPSDSQADDLLVEIATQIKGQDPSFAPVTEVAEIKRRHKKLRKSAIRTFFPKSLDLMWPWLPGAATEFHDDLKKKIIKSHKDTETKLFSNRMLQNQRATSDWYSNQMSNFIPEIRRLSEIPGGLLMAFGLLVMVGNFSYLRDERLDPFYGWGPVPPDWWCGRKSDAMADDLMSELIQRIQEEHPNFRPVTEISQLQDGAKFLSSHDINTFFSKSLPLMASWITETANPNSIYHNGELYQTFNENGMMG
jgi:hypothetical protein